MATIKVNNEEKTSKSFKYSNAKGDINLNFSLNIDSRHEAEVFAEILRIALVDVENTITDIDNGKAS